MHSTWLFERCWRNRVFKWKITIIIESSSLFRCKIKNAINHAINSPVSNTSTIITIWLKNDVNKYKYRPPVSYLSIEQFFCKHTKNYPKIISFVKYLLFTYYYSNVVVKTEHGYLLKSITVCRWKLKDTWF